jgi:cardiolipin synthase (CMP-forming)
MGLANWLTVLRILLIPVFVSLLVYRQRGPALVVFLAAALTDLLDGYVARQRGSQSRLGAFLDPLADKLLLVSIFIALGVRNELPLWLVIAVVSRDILIIAAVLLAWLLDLPVRIKPLAVSKANTVAQIVLAATVLADEAFAFGLVTTRLVMVWITGALTLISLAAYLRAWFMHMTGAEGHSPPDA